MAKRPKMKVVKKGVNSSNVLTMILLSPFYLIYYVVKILLAPPTSPSYFLGFIRLVVFGGAFWCLNWTEIMEIADKSNYNTGMWLIDNWPIPFFALICLIIYSFCVFCGLNSNSTTNSPSNYYPNVDTTMQILDGRLSSPGNRGKFLKKVFDID